jgi:hypothetical protein
VTISPTVSIFGENYIVEQACRDFLENEARGLAPKGLLDEPKDETES